MWWGGGVDDVSVVGGVGRCEVWWEGLDDVWWEGLDDVSVVGGVGRCECDGRGWTM